MMNGVVESSDKNTVEVAKKKAAIRCVDENVKSNQVLGIGTGTTSFYAVEHIGEKFKSGLLKNIFCVPTSIDSRQLIIQNGLNLSDLEQHPVVDVYIDGADEVDQRLDCIKGAGGCLAEEKIVMGCSKKFFIIADYRKKSQELGQNWKTIPVEVCRSAYLPIMKRIESSEGGSCKLRRGTGKAGPLVTDNGNFIVDWTFGGEELKSVTSSAPRKWNALNTRLTLMPGVVETGLFLDKAEKAYFGMLDGSVEVLLAPLSSADRQKNVMNGDSH